MSSSTLPPIRVLLAAADAELRDALAELIGALGHTLLGAVDCGADALARVATAQPDVILVEVALVGNADAATMPALTAAAPDAALVLFCTDDGARLRGVDVGESAALAYLPRPVPIGVLDATLRLALSRGRALAEARSEAAAARLAIQERKLIERAKGILMRRTGSTEYEAYAILRRSSQDRSQPMVRIARAVLESEPGFKASA